MRLAVVCRALLIACSAHALASCLFDPGSDDADSVGGQKLTCTESDAECRCSIAPAINTKVVTECSPATVDAPQGSNVACCEDRLIVNGKDEGVYLCRCRAIRCVATDMRCECNPSLSAALQSAETVVDNCSAFASGHAGVKCCADGDRCICSETSACGKPTQEVPFCAADNLCVEDIGRMPVSACK
jgi:hypothetical protein